MRRNRSIKVLSFAMIAFARMLASAILAAPYDSDRVNLRPPGTFVYKRILRSDFNGDGISDIVLRNQVSGSNSIWLQSGTTRIGGGSLEPIPDQNWQITGTGDFNGDGYADLLWRNSSTGVTSMWLLNANTVIGGGYLSEQVTDSAWQVVTIGDFDGDGNADLFWRNTSTGLAAIWFMNGAARIGGGHLSEQVTDTSWQVVAGGDFNLDGKYDLLWRNSVSGLVSIFLMDGPTRIGGGYLDEQVTDLTWKIAGAADVNNDGRSDLVWRNSSSGLTSIWLMRGTMRIGGGYLSEQVTDLRWQIAGLGDYYSDGNSDILWRNESTGLNSLFFLSSSTKIGGGYCDPADSTWKLIFGK